MNAEQTELVTVLQEAGASTEVQAVKRLIKGMLDLTKDQMVKVEVNEFRRLQGRAQVLSELLRMIERPIFRPQGKE